MPASVPILPQSFFRSTDSLNFTEIAFEVACAFLRDDVDEKIIQGIVDESLDFPVPVKKVAGNVYCLELYHGPTMAFKDVGARFMSRLMAYLYRDERKALNVIVATSGDTGSAVAAGFHGVEGINVFVLFPKGKVSRLQQKQITTWGGNIHAIEVDGSFDDCQRLAKIVLGDSDLGGRLTLTSANSINIARLIPQSFYYFFAYSRLKYSGNPLVFSVPSGNFGNLTAGLMAREAGLPVHKFIASTNANDVFPKFLKSGKYSPRPSLQTISNAMDVGDPSNFSRIDHLMGQSIVNFRESIISWSFSDSETENAIRKVWSDTGYVMDPHGAVAYLGLTRYLEKSTKNVTGVFLGTAHPAKFPETMDRIIKDKLTVPPQLEGVLTREEMYHSMRNDPDEFSEYIRNINL